MILVIIIDLEMLFFYINKVEISKIGNENTKGHHQSFINVYAE